jgi:hypothetical protein
MAIASITTTPEKLHERRVRRRARNIGMRIERSRCLDIDPARPFWLCLGLQRGVLLGSILRDAALEDIETFFRLPDETQQVAIEIAEALEAMSRIDIDNPNSFWRFDVAQRLQSVAQRALLATTSAKKRASLLAEIREIALMGPKQEAA